MQVTHSGVVITYDERQNNWQFTLRNRERVANSLALAKEFINRPVKETKANTFQRQKVYHKRNDCYGENVPRWKIIEATSITARNFIQTVDGKEREQITPFQLFPVGESKNDELVKRSEELTVEIVKLRNERDAVEKKLKALELPNERGDE